MCCLVLASESGPRLSLDHDWVWIVTESGSWLSLDRDWVWIVIITWLIEPGSWTWLIVPGSWRIEVSCWTIEIVSSFRVPGGLPSLLIFENPSLEEDNPGSVTCGVWRRGAALSEFVGSSCVHARLLPRCWYSWVTCYPVFYCGPHGDISIFLLFICVTVLVYIRRYIVSVLHVQVK